MSSNLTKLFFLSLVFGTISTLQAQNVGIGISTPDPSAKLDITDTDKGVLIPRISIPNLAAAAPVTTPATSLLVYNTNATTGNGFYYWNGSQWIRLYDQAASDQDWYEVGTTTAPNDINDNIFTQGNVGIGISNPTSLLHIKGTAPVFNIETNTANQQASGKIVFKETPGQENFQIQYDGLPANEQLNFIGLSTSTAALDTIMSLKRTSSFVGIGTTAPSTRLEVRNTAANATPLRLSRNSTQNVAQAFQNNQDEVFIGLTEDEDFAIGQQEDLDNGAYLLVDHGGGTGNVGIGTITPQAKLDVSAGTNGQTGPVEAIRISGPNTPANSNSAQDLNWQFAAAGSTGIRGYRGSSWDTYLQFYTNNVLAVGNAPEIRMTIDDDGRVGIGTTTPQTITHVSTETDGDAVLRIDADTDDNNEDDNPRVELYQDARQTGAMIGFFDGAFQAGNVFRIGTRTGNVDDWETFSINTVNKNVGIGTVAPIDRFQVNGNARIGLTTLSGAGTYPAEGNRLYFSGGDVGAGNSDNTDVLYIARHNSASDQSQLRMNIGDNTQAQDALSIGYTTAGAYVERFRLQTDGVAQKPGGGTWATLSDRRTKKEITPFKDGLNVLTQINPVTFKYNGQYNTSDDDQNHVGIIAQDVQPVAPYMIGTQITQNGTEQQELLNYDGGTYMIYILVNAVKEQQKQLETATSNNATLQTEMDKLKQENTTMKAQLSELEALKAEVEAIKASLNINAQK